MGAFNLALRLVIVTTIIATVLGFQIPSFHSKVSIKRDLSRKSTVGSQIPWTPSSWQKFPIKQAPNYPDQVYYIL